MTLLGEWEERSSRRYSTGDGWLSLVIEDPKVTIR